MIASREEMAYFGAGEEWCDGYVYVATPMIPEHRPNYFKMGWTSNPKGLLPQHARASKYEWRGSFWPVSDREDEQVLLSIMKSCLVKKSYGRSEVCDDPTLFYASVEQWCMEFFDPFNKDHEQHFSPTFLQWTATLVCMAAVVVDTCHVAWTPALENPSSGVFLDRIISDGLFLMRPVKNAMERMLYLRQPANDHRPPSIQDKLRMSIKSKIRQLSSLIAENT